jgi:hypothetical protein
MDAEPPRIKYSVAGGYDGNSCGLNQKELRMFGMGLWEMLIVLVMGGVFVAVIVAVVKSSSGNSRNFDLERIAQLEEENWRLRKLLAQHGIPQDADAPPKK